MRDQYGVCPNCGEKVDKYNVIYDYAKHQDWQTPHCPCGAQL